MDIFQFLIDLCTRLKIDFVVSRVGIWIVVK